MSTAERAAMPMTPDMFPCPACGGHAIGTVESLVCRWVTGDDGRVIGWDGDDLDSQETLYRNGQPILACEGGHAYVHPLFTIEVMRALCVTWGDASTNNTRSCDTEDGT